ncbi:MAG: hypothetical protein ABI640_14150 [Gammaproteobacteria bacterium]
MTFIVSIWLKDNDVAGFESFERQAATLMAGHGGRVDSVVRCGGEEGTPFEVHLVSFPDAAAAAAYRADPRLAKLLPLRERVIARTDVWAGQQRSAYGAEVAFDEDR